MEVLDYTNMLNRFGKRLEKCLAKDFPGCGDLLAEINSALVKIQYTVISAFMLNTFDKENQ